MNKHNKKVLLRKCKRHTARRVASTRYAVPVGGRPPPPQILTWDLDSGYPYNTKGGGSILNLPTGSTLSWPGMGYPLPPSWTWDGGTLPLSSTGAPQSRCVLTDKLNWKYCLPSSWPRMGVHPSPPSAVQGPPAPIEMCTDRQTENITFPHPSDAGGKNWLWIMLLF